MRSRNKGIGRRAPKKRESGRAFAEGRRETAERARQTAELGRERAETLRGLAERFRQSAEEARHSAEEARRAAEESRRHRDAVLSALEELRRKSEQGRATAEDARRTAAEQFDTHTRRAIREEIEVATEMQRSENELVRKPPGKPVTGRSEKRSRGSAQRRRE